MSDKDRQRLENFIKSCEYTSAEIEEWAAGIASGTAMSGKMLPKLHTIQLDQWAELCSQFWRATTDGCRLYQSYNKLDHPFLMNFFSSLCTFVVRYMSEAKTEDDWIARGHQLVGKRCLYVFLCFVDPKRCGEMLLGHPDPNMAPSLHPGVIKVCKQNRTDDGDGAFAMFTQLYIVICNAFRDKPELRQAFLLGTGASASGTGTSIAGSLFSPPTSDNGASTMLLQPSQSSLVANNPVHVFALLERSLEIIKVMSRVGIPSPAEAVRLLYAAKLECKTKTKMEPKSVHLHVMQCAAEAAVHSPEGVAAVGKALMDYFQTIASTPIAQLWEAADAARIKKDITKSTEDTGAGEGAATTEASTPEVRTVGYLLNSTLTCIYNASPSPSIQQYYIATMTLVCVVKALAESVAKASNVLVTDATIEAFAAMEPTAQTTAAKPTFLQIISILVRTCGYALTHKSFFGPDLGDQEHHRGQSVSEQTQHFASPLIIQPPQSLEAHQPASSEHTATQQRDGIMNLSPFSPLLSATLRSTVGPAFAPDSPATGNASATAPQTSTAANANASHHSAEIVDDLELLGAVFVKLSDVHPDLHSNLMKSFLRLLNNAELAPNVRISLFDVFRKSQNACQQPWGSDSSRIFALRSVTELLIQAGNGAMDENRSYNASINGHNATHDSLQVLLSSSSGRGGTTIASSLEVPPVLSSSQLSAASTLPQGGMPLNDLEQLRIIGINCVEDVIKLIPAPEKAILCVAEMMRARMRASTSARVFTVLCNILLKGSGGSPLSGDGPLPMGTAAGGFSLETVTTLHSIMSDVIKRLATYGRTAFFLPSNRVSIALDDAHSPVKLHRRPERASIEVGETPEGEGRRSGAVPNHNFSSTTSHFFSTTSSHTVAPSLLNADLQANTSEFVSMSPTSIMANSAHFNDYLAFEEASFKAIANFYDILLRICDSRIEPADDSAVSLLQSQDPVIRQFAESLIRSAILGNKIPMGNSLASTTTGEKAPHLELRPTAADGVIVYLGLIDTYPQLVDIFVTILATSSDEVADGIIDRFTAAGGIAKLLDVIEKGILGTTSKTVQRMVTIVVPVDETGAESPRKKAKGSVTFDDELLSDDGLGAFVSDGEGDSSDEDKPERKGPASPTTVAQRGGKTVSTSTLETVTVELPASVERQTIQSWFKLLSVLENGHLLEKGNAFDRIEAAINTLGSWCQRIKDKAEAEEAARLRAENSERAARDVVMRQAEQGWADVTALWAAEEKNFCWPASSDGTPRPFANYADPFAGTFSGTAKHDRSLSDGLFAGVIPTTGRPNHKDSDADHSTSTAGAPPPRFAFAARRETVCPTDQFRRALAIEDDDDYTGSSSGNVSVVLDGNNDSFSQNKGQHSGAGDLAYEETFGAAQLFETSHHRDENDGEDEEPASMRPSGLATLDLSGMRPKGPSHDAPVAPAAAPAAISSANSDSSVQDNFARQLAEEEAEDEWVFVEAEEEALEDIALSVLKETLEIIAQCVFDAATANDARAHHHISVKNFGAYVLYYPFAPVRPTFLNLIPSLHDAIDTDDFVEAAKAIVAEGRCLDSNKLVDYAIEKDLPELLNSLQIPVDRVFNLPMDQYNPHKVLTFWRPLILSGPLRSELRFRNSGGLVIETIIALASQQPASSSLGSAAGSSNNLTKHASGLDSTKGSAFAHSFMDTVHQIGSSLPGTNTLPSVLGGATTAKDMAAKEFTGFTIGFWFLVSSVDEFNTIPLIELKFNNDTRCVVTIRDADRIEASLYQDIPAQQVSAATTNPPTSGGAVLPAAASTTKKLITRTVNEDEPLYCFEANTWVYFAFACTPRIETQTDAYTMSVYAQGRIIGSVPITGPQATSASPAPFLVGSKLSVNIGPVAKELDKCLYSIGEVSIWNECLPSEALHSAMFGQTLEKAPLKRRPLEAYAALTDAVPSPALSLIGRFTPHLSLSPSQLKNTSVFGSATTTAILSGQYFPVPKAFVEPRMLFVTLGGLKNLLQWLLRGAETATLKRKGGAGKDIIDETLLNYAFHIFIEVVRNVTYVETLRARLYCQFALILRRLGKRINIKMARLVMRLAAEPIRISSKKDKDRSNKMAYVIINRHAAEYILADVQLYEHLDSEVAVEMLQTMELYFSSKDPDLAPYAKVNSESVMGRRFTDRLLQGSICYSENLPLRVVNGLMAVFKAAAVSRGFPLPIIQSIVTSCAQMLMSDGLASVPAAPPPRTSASLDETLRSIARPSTNINSLDATYSMLNSEVDLGATIGGGFGLGGPRELDESNLVLIRSLLKILTEAVPTKGFMEKFIKTVSITWFSSLFTHLRPGDEAVLLAVELLAACLDFTSPPVVPSTKETGGGVSTTVPIVSAQTVSMSAADGPSASVVGGGPTNLLAAAAAAVNKIANADKHHTTHIPNLLREQYLANPHILHGSLEKHNLSVSALLVLLAGCVGKAVTMISALQARAAKLPQVVSSLPLAANLSSTMASMHTSAAGSPMDPFTSMTSPPTLGTVSSLTTTSGAAGGSFPYAPSSASFPAANSATTSIAAATAVIVPDSATMDIVATAKSVLDDRSKWAGNRPLASLFMAALVRFLDNESIAAKTVEATARQKQLVEEASANASLKAAALLAAQQQAAEASDAFGASSNKLTTSGIMASTMIAPSSPQPLAAAPAQPPTILMTDGSKEVAIYMLTVYKEALTHCPEAVFRSFNGGRHQLNAYNRFITASSDLLQSTFKETLKGTHEPNSASNSAFANTAPVASTAGTAAGVQVQSSFASGPTDMGVQTPITANEPSTQLSIAGPTAGQDRQPSPFPANPSLIIESATPMIGSHNSQEGPSLGASADVPTATHSGVLGLQDSMIGGGGSHAEITMATPIVGTGGHDLSYRRPSDPYAGSQYGEEGHPDTPKFPNNQISYPVSNAGAEFGTTPPSSFAGGMGPTIDMATSHLSSDNDFSTTPLGGGSEMGLYTPSGGAAAAPYASTSPVRTQYATSLKGLLALCPEVQQAALELSKAAVRASLCVTAVTDKHALAYHRLGPCGKFAFDLTVNSSDAQRNVMRFVASVAVTAINGHKKTEEGQIEENINGLLDFYADHIIGAVRSADMSLAEHTLELIQFVTRSATTYYRKRVEHVREAALRAVITVLHARDITEALRVASAPQSMWETLKRIVADCFVDDHYTSNRVSQLFYVLYKCYQFKDDAGLTAATTSSKQLAPPPPLQSYGLSAVTSMHHEGSMVGGEGIVAGAIGSGGTSPPDTPVSLGGPEAAATIVSVADITVSPSPATDNTASPSTHLAARVKLAGTPPPLEPFAALGLMPSDDTGSPLPAMPLRAQSTEGLDSATSTGTYSLAAVTAGMARAESLATVADGDRYMANTVSPPTGLPTSAVFPSQPPSTTVDQRQETFSSVTSPVDHEPSSSPNSPNSTLTVTDQSMWAAGIPTRKHIIVAMLKIVASVAHTVLKAHLSISGLIPGQFTTAAPAFEHLLKEEYGPFKEAMTSKEVDTVIMKGPPSTKMKSLEKVLEECRHRFSEEVSASIVAFNKALRDPSALQAELAGHEADYMAQFSSEVEQLEPLSVDDLIWLQLRDWVGEVTPSKEKDGGGNGSTVTSPQTLERNRAVSFRNLSAAAAATSAATAAATAKRHYMDSKKNIVPFEGTGLVATDKTSGSTRAVSEVQASINEQYVSHISIHVPPMLRRVPPFGSLSPPWLTPDLPQKLTPSAITLLQYILNTNEKLYFITNGFKISGIDCVPVLIVLTNCSLKLFAYSRINANGDLFIAQRAAKEDGAGGEEEEGPNHHHSFNAGASFAATQFRKLQRWMKDSTKRRALGEKVSKSVARLSTESSRGICWFYDLHVVSIVRQCTYLHQDAGVDISMLWDAGPMLAIMDENLSMTKDARKAFTKSLEKVCRKINDSFVLISDDDDLLPAVTKAWITRGLSTYDYISQVNIAAGRALKDWNQYPVFPWVVKNYSGDTLDLTSSDTFRDLTWPIHAQTESARSSAEMRYSELTIDGQEPWHHATHYTSSAAVLYFMLRLQPFLTSSAVYQGGKLDHADRLFRDVATAYRNATTSSADCKELLPEFYGNGSFLRNIDSMDLGRLQNDDLLNDVELPKWAQNSHRVFTFLMRQALESEYVSSTLHHWLDLVFGSKQSGEGAVKSFNLHKPLTYPDEVKRRIKKETTDLGRSQILCEVQNFGQTPRTAFALDHPKRFSAADIGKTTVTHLMLNPLNIYTLREPTAIYSIPSSLIQRYCNAASGEGGAMSSKVGNGGSIRKLLPFEQIQGQFVRDRLAFTTDFVVPISRTDQCVCFHPHEFRFYRHSMVDGRFIDFVKLPMAMSSRISAVLALSRQAAFIVGTTSGLLFAFTTEPLKTSSYISNFLTAHRNPIAAIHACPESNTIVTFTTSAEDQPVVWRYVRMYPALLFRIPFNEACGTKSVVKSICIDKRETHYIVASDRQIAVFDSNGLVMGVGSLPNEQQTNIPSISSVAVLEAREWVENGVIIYVTGHERGLLGIWRATRRTAATITPDKMLDLTFAHLLQPEDTKDEVGDVAISALHVGLDGTITFGRRNGKIKAMAINKSAVPAPTPQTPAPQPAAASAQALPKELPAGSMATQPQSQTQPASPLTEDPQLADSGTMVTSDNSIET